MGKDLRSALVGAGLASQAQADRIEAKRAPEPVRVDHAFDEYGRPYRFPRGRVCKPLWVKWYLEKTVPVTARSICCECGEQATYTHRPIDLVLTTICLGDREVIRQLFANGEFLICRTCNTWILQGNR